MGAHVQQPYAYNTNSHPWDVMMKNYELEAPRFEAGPSFTSQLAQQGPMEDLGGDVQQMNTVYPWNFVDVPPSVAPAKIPDPPHAGPSSTGNAFFTNV